MSISTKARRASAIVLAIAVAGATGLIVPATASASSVPAPKPTIVLVHGAWADSSSFAPVTALLQADGYQVLDAPNDLRSLSGDSAELSAFLAQRTSGPVVLVGHSYGGAVVTDAALSDPNVKALVYIDAFMPAQGQSLEDIVGESTSALNVPNPTTVFDVVGYPGAPANDADVYLKPSTFATDFAQDLPSSVRNMLEAGQLPITLAALGEKSTAPAWASIPSWDVVGTKDKVLPLAEQLSMAHRAGSHITEVAAGHLSMISAPLTVTSVIIAAANSVR